MKSVLVRPRVFTYTRKAFTTNKEHEIQWQSIVKEVVERQVAHGLFLTVAQDGMMAQFFEITSDGRHAAIGTVTGIVKIDDGVVVDGE